VLSIVRRFRSGALSDIGLRAFFLLAPLAAAVLMVAWIAMWRGVVPMPTGIEPTLWHAHEMVFGFVGAAFAGFLLTAVPNWTRREPLMGWPVVCLALIWVVARVTLYLPGVVSYVLVMVADGAFAIALVALIAREIVLARNYRNLVVVSVLAIWAVANLAFHFGIANREPQIARLAALLGLQAVAFMIVLIGGRVIPAFTANWLRSRGGAELPVVRPKLERLVIALTAVSGLSLVFFPQSPVTAVLSLSSAVVHCARLTGWRTLAVWREPILFVLHVGYLWMVCGYLLLGLSILWPGIPNSVGLHALTTGGIGTMILAIMSRAALGHTGRALLAPPAVVGAYVLVSLAAIARLLASLYPQLHAELLTASGTLWIVAFLAFLLAYWPILTRPRISRG